LNYVITDKRGKQLVVHVNRLKRAYDPVDWQVTKREETEGKVHPKRRQPKEEDYQEIPPSGPIPDRERQVENPPTELRSPVRNRQVWIPLLQAHHLENRLVTIVWIPHTHRQIHLDPECSWE